MPKFKSGPPSKFTQEIADEICDLMILGHDMLDVCDILKLNRPTVYRWLAQFPDFEAQCARAREALTEHRLKEIRERLKNAQKNGLDPQLLKIEASFEQWQAEKIAPRFSQKIRTEVTGANGGPVQIQKIDLSHMTDEELEILDLALNGRPEGDEDDDE